MAGLGFWRIAQANPDWTAVIEEAGGEHKAGDVLARANQTVHALRALGMADGDGLTLLMPNLVEMVEIYAAALQAGWYYTPINFHLAGPEIAYIVHDAEAKAFFCHVRFADIGLAAVAELEKEGHGLPKEALISVGGDIPGFTPLEQFRAGHSTDAARAPHLRHRDALHLRHHRQAQGRAARAVRSGPGHDGRAGHRPARLLRHHPRRRRRAPGHLAELPHRGHPVRRQRAADGPHAGADGQVDAGGHAGDDPAHQGHAHPHGADPVPPHAAPARGGASSATTSPR